MGAVKIIAYLLAIFFIANAALIAVYYFYNNSEKISEVLQIVGYNSGAEKNVNASNELAQFSQDMRFNHNVISFYINPECEESKVTRMHRAFSIINEETGIISFKPAEEISADILVGCSQDSYESEKNVFVSGEGGPTSYFELSFYPMIMKGKVLLYNEDSCDYPITELHELFHVLGFEHINKSNLIMYPYINCNQEINPELIKKLKQLYSIEPLAELYFSNISAVKTGNYLNFSVQINNEGLFDAENVNLKVLDSENKEIDSFAFEKLPIGTSSTFSVTYLRLPSSSTSRIKLFLDYSGKEYNKNNNLVELSV